MPHHLLFTKEDFIFVGSLHHENHAAPNVQISVHYDETEQTASMYFTIPLEETNSCWFS
jgi:hypothetical protein